MIETTVKVEGMACGMCEAHINDAIRKAFKVKKVKSSHKKGEAKIVSESSLDHATVKTAIENTGYIVRNVSECEKKASIFG